MKRVRRAALWALGLALLALLAAGHWLYWYAPRERPMAPGASTLLPRGAERELRLWIPYPHQNLGVLGREVEDPEELLAAAARLLGLPPPRMPRLEPFGVPPVRELLVASGGAGEGIASELLPYPTVRRVARLAGGLAGNPWLSGGSVEAGERRWEVRWDGPVWQAAEGEAAGPEGPAAREWSAATARALLEEPVLGLLEVSRPAPPLPAGRYRLIREPDGLVVTSSPEPGGGREPAGALFAGGDLVLVFLRRQEEGSLEALVLFDRESGLVPGLPAAAVQATSRDGERMLPGGRVLSRLGRLPVRATEGGTLLATDRWALERAAELAPQWQRLASGGEAGEELEMGVWVATQPAAERSRRLLRFLEGFPLTPSAERQRWRDATLLLESAEARFTFLGAWATQDVAELRATSRRPAD